MALRGWRAKALFLYLFYPRPEGRGNEGGNAGYNNGEIVFYC